MTENDIGTIIVDSAIAVHKELGPGFLETVIELHSVRSVVNSL
jgi:hypothetical protein